MPLQNRLQRLDWVPKWRRLEGVSGG